MPIPRPIPFGDWTPDQPDYENPGSVNVLNVLPAAQGYREMPSQTGFGDTIDARCQGAITATQSNGTVRTYAGDATKLYRLVDGVWTDASGVSAPYGISSEHNWEFAKSGETIIATNIADDVQSLTLGGATFGDLITSTLKPKARHVGVTDDFLILGHTEEDGTVYPGRIRVSALGDITDFDQDPVTQSDFQDLSEFGDIQRIIGFGRDAVVLQEFAVRTMRYEGTPTIFRFDTIEEERGAMAPAAVVAFGPHVFFLAQDGFYQFSGGGSKPIGKEKVDNFFFNDADGQYVRQNTFAAIDPSRALVMWAYRSTAATVPAPVADKILVYSWATEKWSLIEQNNEILFNDLSKGVTLEGLDALFATLEDVTPNLDSRFWAGGLVLLSGFDENHQLVNYSGTGLDATLDTKETQHHPGQVSFVDAVRPIVEGASATITVAPITRDKLNEAVTVGSAESLNSIGEADLRSVARYHRQRVFITGGFDHAQGVLVPSQPWGRQ